MKINLPELGIVKINILNPYLLEFAKRQLIEYLIDDNEIENDLTGWYATIEINNDEIFSRFRNISEENHTLSRDFKVDNQTIYYTYMTIDVSKNSVVNIKMRECPAGVKEFLRKVYSWLKRADYGKWHGQFYQYVLFPIFLLYTIADGYYLIHGSALQYKNKNVILTGLDGVGKSSMTSLLSNHGFNVLADNFLLFNGNKIMPLNLPVRADSVLEHGEEVICIYNGKEVSEYISKTYVRKCIYPDVFISLEISETLNCIKKLIDFFSYFMFVNHAPEINEANKFIGPFFYWSIKNNSSKKELELLKLGIPKGKLKEGAEIIINEIKEIY